MFTFYWEYSGSSLLSDTGNSKRKNIYIGLVFVLALVLAAVVTKEYQNLSSFSISGFNKTLTFVLLVVVNFFAINLGKSKPGKTLAVLALCASILVIISMLTFGQFAMWSILAVGLFNSIMFPTIFTLAIDGLGKHTGQASGILCTAIVGGALLPVIQGFFADNIGIHHAFFIPVLCYIYIAYYGMKGHIPSYKTV